LRFRSPTNTCQVLSSFHAVILSDEVAVATEESKDPYSLDSCPQRFSCCHPERSARSAFPTRFFCGSGGRAVEGSAVPPFFYDVGHGEQQVPRLGPASASSQNRAGCVSGLASLGMTKVEGRQNLRGLTSRFEFRFQVVS